MTLDFATSTAALGQSAGDASTFAIYMIAGVLGAVMVAGGVLRGLSAVGRRFGFMRATPDLPRGYPSSHRMTISGKSYSRSEYRHATAQARARFRKKYAGKTWRGGIGVPF